MRREDELKVAVILRRSVDRIKQKRRYREDRSFQFRVKKIEQTIEELEEGRYEGGHY